MTTSRLLIVSNRLPVTVSSDGGEFTVSPSAGGLATGLKGPHEQSGGLWIGWPGDVGNLDDAQRASLDEKLAELRTVPLYLDQEEASRFYEGYSNGLLWPLFHSLVDRIPLESRDWEVYRSVNQRFADLTVAHYRPGDTIWVQDYQLMLVPGMLRERLPSATIGFFLHIPFPSSETFRVLPRRQEILTGLLGADLIGFHTFAYLDLFTRSLMRLLGVEAEVDRVRYAGRNLRLGVFPMGIDAARFSSVSSSPEIIAASAAIRERIAPLRILLGVDRMDYTKGIPRRFLAFERLLEKEPELRGKVEFVQVAVPSRTSVDAYVALKQQVDELVGRINGQYGTITWTPIRYLYRSIPEAQLITLYRAADVMLVTPVRDGLNLVAKEFIASRVDDDGVLVLSELAGAASELGESLRVNPYDIDATAEAMATALALSPEDRKARMSALRRRVHAHDVHQWVAHFLRALDDAATQREPVGGQSPAEEIEALVTSLRAAPSLVLFLDYDGTLVPFAPTPEKAVPDAELLTLLRALSERPRTRVHVVSGRSQKDLERFFGDLPIALHGEHGLWSRSAPGEDWQRRIDPPTAWREHVRPIFELFASRTPGSLVEDKASSLAWHYRMADPGFGAVQAKELRLHLGALLSNQPVEILQGHKVVEIRVQGVNKGSIVQPALSGDEGEAALAIGDDQTDEDLFAALPPHGTAVHVGPSDSRAPHRIADQKAVRRLLHRLLA
ncbi:bifunctional alpha,alpha-trehalose-phosphate synthase (UDP-forming)/trehalose-phosphatase [Chondromyces apiculatus]|uniref:Glucosylglycerol-phosphate synthase n=1 Tax=Chondromyces apiculatus DSM 436 TaxID=1192034 RepID=A0A017TDA4_9BACT|nr:bifunctional alpha,alpha-trehalose-phosphate synthase (UDP-forming)/trehalose-phosphatase [Chondromyces apiculatus]EYF06907.1 alpha,alpha-trehalose-phosphate synthase/trehalose-phosphatase [Chondromyces apiculatus DSM 436]